jgi:ribosomal protein S27AE
VINTDPLNPKIEELYNCKSLEVNKLCHEVIKYYPEEFNKSTLKIVETMAQARNMIQHFCFNLDSVDVKNKIITLHNKIIKPCLKIIGNGKEEAFQHAINNNLESVFCFMEVADNEGKMLTLDNADFTRGMCFQCGNYSFFILYDNTSYPTRYYCSSCDYSKENIHCEDYLICPECGAASLIYDDQLEAGVCL